MSSVSAGIALIALYGGLICSRAVLYAAWSNFFIVWGSPSSPLTISITLMSLAFEMDVFTSALPINIPLARFALVGLDTAGLSANSMSAAFCAVSINAALSRLCSSCVAARSAAIVWPTLRPPRNAAGPPAIVATAAGRFSPMVCPKASLPISPPILPPTAPTP